VDVVVVAARGSGASAFIPATAAPLAAGGAPGRLVHVRPNTSTAPAAAQMETNNSAQTPRCPPDGDGGPAVLESGRMVARAALTGPGAVWGALEMGTGIGGPRGPLMGSSWSAGSR
jgi:hypothetical protein